jgi:hypothetical protein
MLQEGQLYDASCWKHRLARCQFFNTCIEVLDLARLHSNFDRATSLAYLRNLAAKHIDMVESVPDSDKRESSSRRNADLNYVCGHIEARDGCYCSPVIQQTFRVQMYVAMNMLPNANNEP